MFLHPASLKHHLAAGCPGRYALNSVALTSTGVLSTDGHALLFTPYPAQEPGEAPVIPGVNAAAPAPGAEPFLLSLPDAERAAQLAGKPGRHAPAATTLLQAEIQGEEIHLGGTDLSRTQTMLATRHEGQYPCVGPVIPDYSRAVAISVNLSELQRALKALRGVTREEVTTLRILDDQQALGFSCKDGTAMLVMPMTVDSAAEHVPDQLAALRNGPAVAAPAPQEPAEEPDAEDGWQPSETEMQEAIEALDALQSANE